MSGYAEWGQFKRVAGLLFIVICATSRLVPAQERDEGATVAVIRGLEHEWFEAQTNNDNRALNLIFDNGLVYVEYCKLVSKGEYLSRIRQAGPQLNQIEMEPFMVRTFGRTAIVVGAYREKARKDGRPVLKRWRFIDTWVYKENGWVLVSAAAAPLR